MKNIFLLAAILPIMSAAQLTPDVNPKAKAPVVQPGFVISGDIVGIPAGATVKLQNANTSLEIASGTVVEKKITVVKNKKASVSVRKTFVLKGTIAEPDLCFLSIGDLKPFNMYVENSKIAVSGNSTDIMKWKVSGSKSHNDFVEFEKEFTPLAQGLNSAASTINTLMPGAERETMMITFTNLQTSIQKKIDSFVTKKPSSYVSAFVLLVMMNFNNDPVVADARFAKLSQPVQQSYIGKILSTQISEAKIGAIGTKAIEFSQPDTTGAQVALSSFRGKFVLVDFWASWCGPCRDENPNVVSNYQKFSNKNFTVLGVSLDKPGQKDKWLQAIHADGLTWTHVSDLKHWENEVARLYHIQGIPQNILVDPNGVIIGKNLRGPALEAKLCEVLGCN